VLSGALVCAAASLLCWPGARPGDRLADRSARPDRAAFRRVPADRLPVAAAAGVAVIVGIASTPLVAVLAAAGVLAAGRAWNRRRLAAVDDRRVRGLAEALAGFAADLRAGRTVGEAALAAAADCPDGVTAEALGRAIRAPEAALEPPRGGGSWEDAVGRIAAGVRLSARTGCSLAAVACVVEDDLRARLRQQHDLRTAVAAPQASAVLLAALPALALAMGSGIGADPWGVLTTTPVGNALLVLGVGLEAAGLTWSSRLVRRVLP
jgi:tight adherence protein B